MQQKESSCLFLWDLDYRQNQWFVQRCLRRLLGFVWIFVGSFTKEGLKFFWWGKKLSQMVKKTSTRPALFAFLEQRLIEEATLLWLETEIQLEKYGQSKLESIVGHRCRLARPRLMLPGSVAGKKMVRKKWNRDRQKEIGERREWRWHQNWEPQWQRLTENDYLETKTLSDLAAAFGTDGIASSHHWEDRTAIWTTGKRLIP